MDEGDRSLTHCPSCGREVDKLRAGAVGIYSGKMSYFCSRACRDRFSSSGRDAGPGPGAAVQQPAAPPAASPPRTRPTSTQLPRDDLPLLMPRKAAVLDGGAPVAGEPSPDEPVMFPAAGMGAPDLDGPPVPSQLSRWFASAGVGGAAILVFHIALARGWLDASQGLALGLLVPAGLVGILHAALEWRASSVWRAFDEVIVVGAVVICAVPGVLALGRGDGASFGSGILAPLGVLVIVWSIRCVEALAGSGLDRDPELAPVHAPGTLAGLLGEPTEWGRSRLASLSLRLSLAMTGVALPVGLLIVLASVLLSGRHVVEVHWSLASAVVLSLSPRLFRNVLPAVMASSLLRARRKGIIFHGDNAFERAGRVSAVVLRKQGVLVEPGSEVIEFHQLGELPAETVLALVASCEGIASGTEVAEALMRHARREGVKPGDTRLARHLPSRGIHSTSPFGEIFVGNRLFLIENGISVGRGETVSSEAEKRGQTAVFISINRRIEAVAILANRLRPSSRQAVDRCHAIGLTTVLITGDSYRTAESIGSTLGIDQVRPEVAVASREQEVGRLRDTGHRLAVLGSLGLDVPRVEEQTDVRLGMGWDGEAAVDPAWDVVVGGEDLVRAVEAIEISRAGRWFLLVNWAIALLTGGLTFGFAASGLVSPIVACIIVNLAAAVMMIIRPRPGSRS